MGYPKRLLPSKGKKALQPLARWHDPEKDGSIFNEDGTIDVSLIHYKRYPGLSCNYYPPSECQDLKIVVTNPNLKYQDWKEGDEPVEIEASDYLTDEAREVYAFPLDKIINTKLPYKIGEESHLLEIQIVHKPLVANFPHCEFRLKASHVEGELKKLSRKQVTHNIIIHSLENMMENHACL